MKKITILLIIVVTGLSLRAQQVDQRNAAEIYHNLRKLNFLGSVLFVAAHPDDENTRVITYLANGQLAETAYLAMTRGDGGQNLIGPEIRDQLGLIRTQELLAARRIDGGKQFFTRANDFGFSKSADETFRIWGKDEILSDVVRVYRQYQPDVVITRFPPDERAGHGHHTASAVLAIEAYDLSGNATVYPDQVASLGTWQPKRLMTNTGRFFNNNAGLEPGTIQVDVGGFDPLLGSSYTEIASESRSQHKSQGFGSAGARGSATEFLEYVKGAEVTTGIFDGVNTTWSRVKGGEKIQPLVDRALKEFDISHPEKSVSTLLQIRKGIIALEPGVWKDRKLAEVNSLIEDCLGLYLHAAANNYWTAPGEKVTVDFEFVNRLGDNVALESITADKISIDTTVAIVLKHNERVSLRKTATVDSKSSYSDPYWLKEPHGVGTFTVSDKNLIGKPENDPAVQVTFALRIDGEPFVTTRPLLYRWTDRVKGELIRPFEIMPPVLVNTSGVLIFSDNNPKPIEVVLSSASNGHVAGTLRLELPAGWRSEPAAADFEIAARGGEVRKSFVVYPSRNESSGMLKAIATVNGKSYDKALQEISYDHFPAQTLLHPAQTKVVRLDLKENAGTIGYIEGAGDDTPASLRNMGYDVVVLKNENVTTENLDRFKAIVMGIRVLNVNERIPFIMPALLDYVKRGGTLVMQYNTSLRMDSKVYAPYAINISRDRTTEEDAVVKILKPEHPALNYPNKITTKDFEGWVQELGLYYPSQWAPEYEALLSMADTGEDPVSGSLLVARYGEGYYVYTGLSFFRELPEGVPGAYRLFANLVSLGSQPKTVKK